MAPTEGVPITVLSLHLRGWDDEPSFFVIRGEGGGAILEEAGTFSGQALLLSYPYPRGGGGPVKEAGTHSISNHTQHPAQGWNRYFTLNLFPHKI